MNPGNSIRVMLALTTSLLAATPARAAQPLRVCADPDNLPFSNQKGEGFENRIAALLAKDMRTTLNYTWLKQRQSFFRQTLGEKRCDVVIGVPSGFERALTTQAYYRSGYVIISRKDRDLHVNSWDDPILRNMKIGLHAIGNDGANSPPASALGRRGLAGNIVGFSMWGEGTEKNPQGKIVDAVANGKIDLAMVWGPIGGYFARKYGSTLVITPAPADPAMPAMAFRYDIAMGVRKDDAALAARLEKTAERKQREIRKILSDYGVPVMNTPDGSPSSQPVIAQPDH